MWGTAGEQRGLSGGRWEGQEQGFLRPWGNASALCQCPVRVITPSHHTPSLCTMAAAAAAACRCRRCLPLPLPLPLLLLLQK